MKNKNNKITILFMTLIIIILVVLSILFVANKILVNNGLNQEKINNKANDDNQTKEDENTNAYIINYKEESYTPQNKEGIEFANSKRNIITVENEKNTNAASLIENKLNEISDKRWEDIKKEADDINDTSYTGVGVNYLIETGEVTNNRLTFVINTVGSFGGVSWDNNEGYNFDATTGDILKLTDIGIGVFDYIYNQSISQIEKADSKSSCLEDDWKDKIKTELNKDGNWYFTSDGIKVIFPRYSIACGAGGSTTIDISKNEVNSYLNEKYQIK